MEEVKAENQIWDGLALASYEWVISSQLYEPYSHKFIQVSNDKAVNIVTASTSQTDAFGLWRGNISQIDITTIDNRYQVIVEGLDNSPAQIRNVDFDENFHFPTLVVWDKQPIEEAFRHSQRIELLSFNNKMFGIYDSGTACDANFATDVSGEWQLIVNQTILSEDSLMPEQMTIQSDGKYNIQYSDGIILGQFSPHFLQGAAFCPATATTLLEPGDISKTLFYFFHNGNNLYITQTSDFLYAFERR